MPLNEPRKVNTQWGTHLVLVEARGPPGAPPTPADAGGGGGGGGGGIGIGIGIGIGGGGAPTTESANPASGDGRAW